MESNTDQFQSPFSSKCTKSLKISCTQWIKLLIWTVGVIFLTSMTSVDVFRVFNEYIDQNVATQITVIKNETVQSPNVSVCLRYHSEALFRIAKWVNGRVDRNVTLGPSDRCPECMALQQNSWDVWNQIDDPTGATLGASALATAFMKRLVNESAQDLDVILRLDQSNFNWNEGLLDSIFTFFSCLSSKDMTYAIKSIPDYEGDLCSDLNFSEIGYVSRNLTDLLFQKLVDFIDLYMNIHVVNETGLVIDSILNRKTSVSIKGDRFCIALLPTSQHKVFIFNRYRDKYNPPWLRSSDPTLRCSVFYDTVLYSFVPAQQRIYKIDWRVLSRYTLNDDVTLAHSVHSRVIESRPDADCDQDPTPIEICLAKLQFLHIAKRCGCVPFMYRHVHVGYEDLPYCNLSAYLSCTNHLHENLNIYDRQCRNKCIYTFHDWQTNSENARATPTQWYCRLNFTQTMEPFVQFTITKRDTPEKFLAQIGGLVNLYLGLSGVSLCAFVVFCIDLLRQWHGGRKQKETQRADETHEAPMRRFAAIRDQGGYVTREELLEENEKLKKELAASFEDIVRKIMNQRKY